MNEKSKSLAPVADILLGDIDYNKVDKIITADSNNIFYGEILSNELGARLVLLQIPFLPDIKQ